MTKGRIPNKSIQFLCVKKIKKKKKEKKRIALNVQRIIFFKLVQPETFVNVNGNFFLTKKNILREKVLGVNCKHLQRSELFILNAGQSRYSFTYIIYNIYTLRHTKNSRGDEK